MPGDGGTLAGRGDLPHLVPGRLTNELAAVIAQVPFELALLHTAISTDSTKAQPSAGIAPPLAPALVEDESDGIAYQLARLVQVLALALNLGELRNTHVHPAIARILEHPR